MIITNIENYLIDILNPNPNTSLKGNSFIANYDAMLKRRFDVIKIHLLDKNKAEEKDWWISAYPTVYMVSLFIGINALSSIGCMLISYRIR